MSLLIYQSRLQILFRNFFGIFYAYELGKLNMIRLKQQTTQIGIKSFEILQPKY